MKRTATDPFHQAMEALKAGNTRSALHLFEEALENEESPELLSHMAFCLAAERQDYTRAVSLCRDALSEDPGNSEHYLNLGRIYLLQDRKRDAIRIFRDGLLHGNNPRIRDELRNLGTRKYPVLASLPREHHLNVFLGKLFTKLKLR